MKANSRASGSRDAVSAGAAVPDARADPAGEYDVKAVYLFNFARFTTWPDHVFASPSTPIAMCILGHDPFGPVLDRALAGETIDGRALTARRLASAEGVEGCQLLFLDAVAAATHAAFLQTLATRAILTVGDDEAFVRAGGMVGFSRDGATIRIAVNPDAVRRGGLAMSSQLLRIARIVDAARIVQ